MPSEYDALLDAPPAQQKSEYDALLTESPQPTPTPQATFAPGSPREIAHEQLAGQPVVQEQMERAGRAIGETALGFVKGLPSMLKYIAPPKLADILGGAAETLGEIKTARESPIGSQQWWNAVVPVAAQVGMEVGGMRVGSPKLSETLFGEKPPVQTAPLSEAAASEQITKGVTDATKPDSEASAIPTEQGKPVVSEAAVQAQTRDTRQTPSETTAQEVEPFPSISQSAEEARRAQPVSTEGQAPSVSGETKTTEGGVSEEVQKGQEGEKGRVLGGTVPSEQLASEQVPEFVLRRAREDFRKLHPWSTDEGIRAYDEGVEQHVESESRRYLDSLKSSNRMFISSASNEGEKMNMPVSEGGKASTESTLPVKEESLPGAVSGTESPTASAPPTEVPKTISESPDPSNVTSIKNEIVDREREARGLAPAVEPARRAFGEAWEQASKKINDNPQYIETLLNNIRGKPRALTDVEDAALLHRQIDLQNQFDKVSSQLVRAQESGNEDAIVENRVRYAQLSDQLLDLYNVGKASGTETGRGLAARKLLANENFTLANMITQKRAALQGKALTPEQMSEVEGYNKDILEADRKLAEYEKVPKKESARLKAAKTRMEMAKTDLERRMAFSDYEKAQRAEPIKLDEEGLQLRADLERTKQAYWQSLTKDRLAQRTITEKFQDTFAKWRRGFLLSSPNVLAKLTSAAAERMTFTPMEEVAGAGLRKLPLVSQVAERAPMEGHPSIRSEAKAITEGFTAGAKDAWDVLRTGRSALDVEFGKKHVLPPQAIDFIGQVHGALKTIPKRNEFARRFQQGVEQAISQGVDATDPLVQTRIATQAYKQAQRSIFLQDNRVVEAFQRGVSRLEQPDPTTGRVPASSKALATGLKVLFPIVKVPTNIVAETLQYSTGLVTGSARLGNAFRLGIENLKPEEADLIMRELKKGSVGGAVLLLGYLNANKVGGYYQPGQRRDKSDVGFGKLRMFGVDIPTYLIHNPLLEQLQVGATIRRVAESKLRRKDMGPQGIPSGIMAAALGVTDEVPFVRETFGELPKLFRPNERQQFLGELSKSLAVPAIVQWAAYQTDKRNGGEPVKRKADTILENIESGIPGLRQRLPEKQDRGVRQPFAQ